MSTQADLWQNCFAKISDIDGLRDRVMGVGSKMISIRLMLSLLLFQAVLQKALIKLSYLKHSCILPFFSPKIKAINQVEVHLQEHHLGINLFIILAEIKAPTT